MGHPWSPTLVSGPFKVRQKVGFASDICPAKNLPYREGRVQESKNFIIRDRDRHHWIAHAKAITFAIRTHGHRDSHDIKKILCVF